MELSILMRSVIRRHVQGRQENSAERRGSSCYAWHRPIDPSKSLNCSPSAPRPWLPKGKF